MSDRKPSLLGQLADIFAIFEKMGLMVGTVWVNPRELSKLAKHPNVFDQFDPHVRRMLLESGSVPGVLLQPGTPEGHLWGAEVRCATFVVDNHVVIAPAGMVVSALDEAACIKLGVVS
jgi:hypothetical protein